MRNRMRTTYNGQLGRGIIFIRDRKVAEIADEMLNLDAGRTERSVIECILEKYENVGPV